MDAILYRWWDADGNLLYVGKSVSVFARITAHRRNSAFFREAAAMTLERFDFPESLSAAEVAAIRKEMPLYNVQHSTRSGGDNARTITIIDGPLPAIPSQDLGAGYWTPADPSSIQWGDLIRCMTKAGVVEVQGLVDDTYSDEEEDGFDGWVVITDDGLTAEVSEVDFLGLYDLYRWTCASPEDPYREHALDAYYDRVKSEVA